MVEFGKVKRYIQSCPGFKKKKKKKKKAEKAKENGYFSPLCIETVERGNKAK